jgi:predicted alpha/beta hydrolase family esterase
MTVDNSDSKQVVFIRGAGDGAYEEDAKLAASLQDTLGATYKVRYPQMPDDDAPNSAWLQQIDKEIAAIKSEVILVGHSFGSCVLLKYLAENNVEHPIAGIFLMATPFWGGEEGWQYEGFRLAEDFSDHLPGDIPLFLYHNRDDPVVPFAHLAIYTAQLPQAIIHQGASGGHQFDDNSLKQVVLDIKSLK